MTRENENLSNFWKSQGGKCLNYKPNQNIMQKFREKSVQIKLKCVGCEEISIDNFSVIFYIIFCWICCVIDEQ